MIDAGNRPKDDKGGNMQQKEVMILTGAGQIGMAIARRLGFGMK